MTKRWRLAARTAPAIACLAIGALVAGCSSSSSGTGSGGAGAKATGGSLTIGSSVAPPTLDLTSNPAAAIDEVLDYNVYQHLVQLAPNGQIVPVLASSYVWSNGDKTITFTLRPDVKFSDGDPMTAQDVVYSINRVIAPKSTYPYAALMGKITSVTAPASSTVQVRLSQPDNEWLYQLAAYSNGVILDPKAVAAIATQPAGTGPYKVTNFVQNYSVTLAVIGSDTVPGDPWYSASYAQTYPYNPAKARQLLAQAGYPGGFSTTLTIPPYGYAETAGPLPTSRRSASRPRSRTSSGHCGSARCSPPATST
jgi:ABC-type transport system substrate-binding protein